MTSCVKEIKCQRLRWDIFCMHLFALFSLSILVVTSCIRPGVTCSRLFAILPTTRTVRALHSYREKIPCILLYSLVDSPRIVSTHTPGALTTSSVSIFLFSLENKFKISTRRDSNSCTNNSLLRTTVAFEGNHLTTRATGVIRGLLMTILL